MSVNGFGDANLVNSHSFNATTIKFTDKFEHQFSHMFVSGNILLGSLFRRRDGQELEKFRYTSLIGFYYLVITLISIVSIQKFHRKSTTYFL